MSVDSNGAQANGPGGGDRPAVTADGRFVAFTAGASNLVAGDTNGVSDVFVRDVAGSVTVRVSIASGGAEAHGASSGPSICREGRFVAFESVANDLVPFDGNGAYDVFVHDRGTGVTTRESVDSSGNEGFAISSDPSLSADGRTVAFASWAGNLVAADTNATSDVFVRDRAAARTVRVSVDSSGIEGDDASHSPSISPEGRFVAFASRASNLVAGDTNGRDDVFVHDLRTGRTVIVSIDSSGGPANGHSGQPSLSRDARFVAFRSEASDLIPGDGNPFRDVFVRDMILEVTSKASVATSGAPGDLDSEDPSISADGRFVAFASDAGNLLPGGSSPGLRKIFVRDRQSGETECVSVDAAGTTANHFCRTPHVSSDGRHVVFVSFADNLVPGDTNQDLDTFRRDRGVVCGTAVAYCTPGIDSAGCAPRMTATGVPSASATSGFLLRADAARPSAQGSIFFGITGPRSVPWAPGSTSVSCVRAPIQRTPIQLSGGAGACAGTLDLDWLQFMASHPNALGRPLLAGRRFHAQAWFRDPPSPKHSSLSDALAFSLCP